MGLGFWGWERFKRSFWVRMNSFASATIFWGEVPDKESGSESAASRRPGKEEKNDK